MTEPDGQHDPDDFGPLIAVAAIVVMLAIFVAVAVFVALEVWG